MKTIHMSYDVREWTRYHIRVEVDPSLSVEAQREQLVEKIMDGEFAACGSEVLSSYDTQTEYNFPNDLGGPT